MDVLLQALKPLLAILNRNIQETTPARELCRELSGSNIAIRIRNTAMAASFIVDDDRLRLSTEISDDADVIVDGSLLTLARLAGGSGQRAIRDGSLEFSGDAEIADRFQRLLILARPDAEEELSQVVGDVAAHRLAEMARGVMRWRRDAHATMGANIREYLQEESRDAPSRYEVERFSGAVNKLRDDVARLEARLNLLRAAD